MGSQKHEHVGQLRNKNVKMMPVFIPSVPLSFPEVTEVGCQQTVPECCSDDTKIVKTCHPPSVCPKGCTCDGTIVRCSGLGLTEFPANIPTDTTEL